MCGINGTAFNKRYTLRRRSAAPGFDRLGHSATLHSHASLTHILPALVLLRKPLFGLAKRRIPRTLGEIKPKIIERFEINHIDKIKEKQYK